MTASSEAGVPVAFIVACAENGVIGLAGGMPWHLSGDLKFFKAQTLGKPVVMGRKTYDSIGRPLPGRPNLVITRAPDFRPEGVEVFRDVEAALARAQALAAESGAEEVMVIGGGQIFEKTLHLARRIYLTVVHARPQGDTLMPELDPAVWKEVRRDAPVSGGEGQPDYSIVILERR